MKFLALIAIIASVSYSASKSEAQCYENATEMFDEFCEKPVNDKSDRAFGDRIGIANEFNNATHAFNKNNGNTCTHFKVMSRKIKKYNENDVKVSAE